MPGPDWVADAVVVFAGLATVVAGATLIVNHGVQVAQRLGIPGALIGILVGAATSLPEVIIFVLMLYWLACTFMRKSTSAAGEVA